jgi:hypothetical protein
VGLGLEGVGGVSKPLLDVENNSCFIAVDVMVVLISYASINKCCFAVVHVMKLKAELVGEMDDLINDLFYCKGETDHLVE